MRMMSSLALLAVVACASACHLADSKRCDDGQAFDDSLNACVPTDTDTSTDTSTDTGVPDGGGDGGTGMMTPCSGPEDCAGFIASYCLNISYGTIVLNGCVISGCTVDPDSCPAPNTCCDINPTYESMLGLPDTLCMPPEYWDQYSTMVCLNV
jgi:hypothetical protein